MYKTSLLTMVGPVVLCLAQSIPAQEKEKEEKPSAAKDAAKRTVLQFLNAAKAKDLEALVKLTDVPWYSDGNRIIKDRAELKKDLKMNWIELAAQGRPLPTEVFRIASYAEIRELIQEPRRKLADDVFAKDDWVVFVQDNAKEKQGVLFVRLRDGKGKVIGAGE